MILRIFATGLLWISKSYTIPTNTWVFDVERWGVAIFDSASHRFQVISPCVASESLMDLEQQIKVSEALQPAACKGACVAFIEPAEGKIATTSSASRPWIRRA